MKPLSIGLNFNRFILCQFSQSPAIHAEPSNLNNPRERQSRRWGRRFYVGIVLLALFFNLRWYVQSPLASHFHELPPNLLQQLRSNKAALDAGAPADMQALFPEGFCFCYLFHGLTWVELALRDPQFTAEAIQQATHCLEQIDSQTGKAAFPRELPPDHGMFYSSWRASLLSGIVRLQSGSDQRLLERLRQEADAIVVALNRFQSPFLPSYRGAAWPCDSFPAIHALNIYDRVTGKQRYQAQIRRWLQQVKERLDVKTGLIPHTAGLPNGHNNGPARATSQVIILRYLADIDPLFARQQYSLFRKHFFTTFLGIPCVREYPVDMTGNGDIDSGPLIFGRSLTGTVATMGVAQMYGDQSFADAIAQTGEVVGLPWTSQNRKSYVGGVMPVGEIIVAWSHVAVPWYSHTHSPEQAFSVSTFWRVPVHCLTLLFTLPLFKWYRKKRSEIR